jgi:hypothetical protein
MAALRRDPRARPPPVDHLPAENPAMIRSSVVFPAPDAPRIAVSEPGATASDTPRSTGVSAYDLQTPETDSAVMGVLHE